MARSFFLTPCLDLFLATFYLFFLFLELTLLLSSNDSSPFPVFGGIAQWDQLRADLNIS